MEFFQIINSSFEILENIYDKTTKGINVNQNYEQDYNERIEGFTFTILVIKERRRKK